jgi:DNA-binding response OmpR family regulator
MLGQNRTILVVDDEVKIVEVIRSYLENAGYRVLCAFTGTQALDLFDRHAPILVVLDLMLPDISGENVCRSIRRKSKVPILMLTAKIDEQSILKGLEIGADDYVTKPFSPKQLIARVEAILRRVLDAGPMEAEVSYNGGDLVIDSLRHEVRKNGESVALTPNEYSIFVTMAKHPTKVFTREELITFALGDGFEGYERVIDTHIKNIKQKVETDSKSSRYILTVYGVGCWARSSIPRRQNSAMPRSPMVSMPSSICGIPSTQTVKKSRPKARPTTGATFRSLTSR